MRLRTWSLAVLPCALLAWTSPDAAAQQRQISGTVTSAASGAPLAGAQVTLSGTNRGANTGADGSFTVSAPSGDTRLSVRMLGFRSREVAVPASQSSVQVRLEADVLNLEGIVVTGQATSVARRNAANAVASISAQELNAAPAQTVEQAMTGKLAGAIISTNSGAPGGGIQLDLRGVSSINASADPLWVIDGVVVSNVSIPSGQNAVTQAVNGDDASNQDVRTNRIADLNPEDIESIEVLKGSSAAAIYGSKAANGVILVTTRRGRDGAPRVNVSQRLGFYQLSNTLGTRRFTLAEAVAKYGAGVTAAFGDGTHYNHEEQLAGGSELGRETSVSVSGGSGGGATRYYVSGMFMDEPGIIENTGYEKQSLRMNLDQRLGHGIDLSVNTNLLHSVAARGLTNNDNRSVSYYVALSGTPGFIDLRPQNGVFPFNPLGASNPLQTAALMTNDEDTWRFIGSGTMRVPVWENDQHSVRLSLTGGADYFQQRNRLISPPELQFEAQSSQPGTSILALSDNLNLNGNANLVHVFAGSALTATTSLGLQYEDRDLNINRTIAHNLAAGQTNVDAGPAPRVFQTRNRTRDVGLFAQEEMLLLDSRLLLTGGLRADRSSNNGDPDEYFIYPKAAASYRIPNLLDRIDELKLRLAYGETGNQPLYGQKFTNMDPSQSVGGQPGIIVTGIAGAPDIRPERSREIEGGVDVSLAGGRLYFEATAYTSSTTDLLLTRTAPPSSGFVQEIFNGGELRTRGLELALQAQPLRRWGATWDSRTTFYTTKSTIEDLPVPSFRTGAFGSTSLGVFQIEEGRSATQIVGRNGTSGGVIVEEQLGDATPQWKMGFSNQVTWGPLNLHTLFDWQHGGDVINLTRLLYDAGEVTEDYVDQDGTISPVDECYPNCSGIERISGFGTFTQQYLEDASFVKLREVTLTWRVPTRSLNRIVGEVQSATVSLSGRNLVTWTDYSGLDPEVSNFGNQQIARSVDVAPFPPSRSFWLTFNFGF
jgi:TonB-dependent starch-binding outer membrane protein SusC